jgi:hypothetical protein
MRTLKTLIAYTAAVLLLAGCNLQKEVDLDLPEYEPKIVVESYLQPGQPYFLFLTESAGYFDGIQVKYLRDAVVTIKHGSESVTLQPIEISIADAAGILDTALLNILKPVIGETVYIYGSLFQTVPEVYNEDFTLNIELPDGRKVSAVTRLLSPVKVDKIDWKFNADSLAYTLTQITDPQGVANYYRRVFELRRREIRENPDGTLDTVLYTNVEQDFYTNDDIVGSDGLILYGTNYDYRVGDTLTATLYHITRDYYRFLETRDAAIIANLSPFGTPAVVYTNIVGGTGVFAGLSQDKLSVVVK